MTENPQLRNLPFVCARATGSVGARIAVAYAGLVVGAMAGTLGAFLGDRDGRERSA